MAAHRVRAKVAQGNLRLIGGYRGEDGAAMPFGQGLARQLVNVLSRVGLNSVAGSAWLPDGFGFSLSLLARRDEL